jgi:hypothetical protein
VCETDSGDLRGREDGLGHDPFVGGDAIAFERVVSGETTLVRGHGRELRVAGGVPRGVDVPDGRPQIGADLEAEAAHLETEALGSERSGFPPASGGQARLLRRQRARLAVVREVRGHGAPGSGEPRQRRAG